MVAKRWRSLWRGRPLDMTCRLLFDPDFYRAKHPETVRRGRDPYAYFMRTGWRHGHDPHPLFDVRWYLSINADVRAAGVNPLRHFMEHGWREGRDPHPLFNVPWYVATNADVLRDEVNPVLHYLTIGAAAGCEPHPGFDGAAYAARSTDVEAARRNPLLHFLASAEWTPTLWSTAPLARPARNPADYLDHVLRLAAREDTEDPLDIDGQATPLISFVVPVFDTRTRYLDDLLASFCEQPTGLAELVLSDDGSTSPATRRWLDRCQGIGSVRIVRNAANRGIAAATNAGIVQAAGAWIALLDHDDALVACAVSRVVRALRSHPDCQLLYTDEVITDRHLRPVAFFHKPAWDPVLLSGVNYINHLSVYRKDRLAAVGGLRDGFQGSQDYDLLLRYTAGLAPGAVIHLPYPAYLWRRDGTSLSVRAAAASTASAQRALHAHFARPDRPVEVGAAGSSPLHRVTFDPARRRWPRISVVIPSRDGLPLITRVLDGLIGKTDYPGLDIMVVDNGSVDPAVLALYERHRNGPTPFAAEIRPEPFNFSRSVNRGVAATTGELVLLLNNDVEVLEPGWLKEMASCFAYPETGIVGAKLLYPDRSIQHVGVIAGLNGLAGHWFVGKKAGAPGLMGRLQVRQSLSAVTGAAMLVSRACVDRVGPFDDQNFPIAYNDVDFCLRAVGAGFRVVFTPFATLIHHESLSRGSDDVGANATRFRSEKAMMRQRHATETIEDRAFNPWLSRYRPDFPPVLLDRLPPGRA